MPTVEFQGTLHEFPDTFTAAQIGRALKGVSLRGQQDAARNELPPRLAGLMPAPDAPEQPAGIYRDMENRATEQASGQRPAASGQLPAGIYRDMEQGFAPTMPTALPRAPRITAQDAARAFDVLGAAAEFARQGAFNPNASTELDERMARDVTPGIPSKIAAGVQQTAAGLADPEAVAFMAATAGLGALPVAAQRAASLGFAGWMAANAGTQAAELEQAVKDDDVEAAARATAGLGLDSLFAGLSAKHGLQGIAARNPRLAGWLSKRLVQEVPPEQVRGVLDRAAAGTATAGELEVAGLLRSARIADAAGAGGVVLRGQVPRVGPAFQDWLGVPAGRGSVEVRDGRPVNPVDRLLLEDAAQSPRPRTSDPIIPPSPPETAPPEVIPPSTPAPAPAGLPTIRGEAAMETRPSAGWTPDGRREPAVSPDLAETIQALREGYVPEVEKVEAVVESPKGDPMLSDFENARRAGMPTPRTDAAEKRLRSLRPPRTNQEAEGMVNALESARHADTQLHQLSERVKAMPDEQLAEFAQATARDAKLASMKSVREHNEQASETARKEIKRRAATPPPSPAPAETIAALRAGYRPEVEKLPEPVAAPFPPYAEKLGIKSWQQAKKLGLNTIITDAPDMAREVVRAAANWIYSSPERAAEHIAGEIVTKTRLLGGRDTALRSLANDYRQKAKGATEPGQEQRFNATAQALEGLQVRSNMSTGKPWDMSREEYVAAETRRWGTTAEEESRAYDELLAAASKPAPTPPTRPAEVRPAESGEQPKPPAQAAPAMQEGMDNLRFTSDPVKTAKTGGADAKDAKAKLIAELEKAVEQSPALTEAQTEAVKEMRQALDASSKARSERMAAAAIEMEKSGLRKVTVEIPGDGTFTVWNTKENLGELLRKAKKLETAIKPPKGYSETGVSKEDREWTAQMQAAQGKPFVDWWVPVNEYAPDAPNNKNVVKTVSARTAFEAEQEAASLPGVVAVQKGAARPAPPSPTGAGGGSGNASVGDFRAPVPAQAASKPQAAADAGFAESGLFVDGVEVRLGGSEAVNPVLLPEMYRLFHELTGGESPFLRRYRKANGMFYGEGAGRIGLHPDLFKFPHQVAYTFAHELGHLVDYLPDRALDRGNVLGRIGALRGWLTTTFPLHPKTSLDEVLKPNDRAKLRREAEKAIGPKPADKTDAAAWQEQISERYGEMVEQEIEARGLISLKQVRDELLAVSQWWRPYDPATATESYRAYRESGVELYADALSVLFNSPGHLEQKAPTFYKAFWNWLDAKPEFKAALARVQELLGKGDAEVLRARVADDRADFAKGREAFEAAHAEQERLWSDPKEVLRRLERQLLDKGAELERIAKAERGGGVLPVGPDLREKWEQMNMADNLIYQFSARIVRDVVKPLQDAGLDANTDLGIYLKHARIQGNKSAREELDVLKARLGRPVYLLAEKFADLMEELERKGLAENLMIDKVILPAESAGIEFEDITELARLRIEQGTRADLANPRMVQAKESERTLNQYLSDLGPAKSAVLKQAVQAFHDEVFKLVEHGHRAGIFSDRQLALAAVNKDTYAAFRPLEYVDTYVQPTMRKAKGSAKPIENPFVTTMLKMQSLADLIMRQKSLNTTRDTMQRLDPEAFKLAETFWTPNGKQARSAPRDRVRLVVREQGKPVAYDVDPAIAEAYQKLSPYEQNVAARWVNWFFHQSLYKGYVSWSLPFNLWNNPWRDVSRTQLNMAAVFGKRAPSVAELARAYKDAWDSAKKYTQGELTPLSQEALDFYAIYAPTDAFYSQFPEDNASHAIMVKLGLAPEPPNRLRTLAGKIPVVKQAVAFGDWIQAEGQKREAVGKLGPWLALQRAGVNPEQAATFVRNYVGTPNIKSAGSQSYIPNAIFPFYRIYSQAARTWVRLARNPQTRGGYFYQWAITRGTMRALLSLAGLGAFGVAAKQWIDGVPEYERTRGIPLPLPPGSQPGGDYGSKSVFLRIPDDEFSALLGYSLDNAIRAAAGQKEPGKAASDAAKQWLTSAPGLNTYADLASQWMAYAGGGEPRDNFRGRPVLSEAERKAGGTAALGKMAQFTADKSGIPFMRQNPTEPTSTPEAVLRFVPLLKDIVKVTDAGFREKDQAQRDAVEQVKYAIRMDYGDNTKSLLHRHAQLDRAGTTRTLPQEADYRYLQAWHSTYNRFDAAVVDAQQRGEKGAAKERIAALERLSASTKTALDTGHAARDAAATGGRNLPWSPRLTNAVPVRK